MGLKQVLRYSSVFLLAFAAAAAAAPKLRLSTTAVGPVVVAQGGSVIAPTVDFSNAGDGALNLTAKSSVPWINPVVGSGRLVLNLQTTALTRGTYTGTVTVSDPNAVDAPQTISVTVQIGSAIPDKIDLYVPPNGSSDELDFVAGSKLNSSITTQGNLPFLSLTGSGSFTFNVPYQLIATHQQGMAEGNYTASLVTSGSNFTADNKTTPVTFHVTSQPIARLSTTGPVFFRLAQGSPKSTQFVSVSNSGQGTLSVTAAAATTASGGSWLATEVPTGFSGISITADPTSTAPGIYQGTVTVTTNAVNAPITVPVQLEVLASGTPYTFFQGAVNNSAAERGDTLAQGTIVALFGEQFTAGAPQQGAFPLTTDLAGTKVFVNDQPAPLFYSSYGQINFQVPYNATTGAGVIRVDRSGQRGNSISVNIATRAPRILRLGIGDYGIIVNSQDGSFPIPQTAGIASHPAKAGDVLVIYAIGLGQTTPTVTEGTAAPSNPLATTPSIIKVLFGGGGFNGDSINVTPMFAGLTPGFAGLYQINVTVPEGLRPGNQAIILQAENGVFSKPVNIAVQ